MRLSQLQPTAALLLWHDSWGSTQIMKALMPHLPVCQHAMVVRVAPFLSFLGKKPFVLPAVQEVYGTLHQLMSQVIGQQYDYAVMTAASILVSGSLSQCRTP